MFLGVQFSLQPTVFLFFQMQNLARMRSQLNKNKVFGGAASKNVSQINLFFPEGPRIWKNRNNDIANEICDRTIGSQSRKKKKKKKKKAVLKVSKKNGATIDIRSIRETVAVYTTLTKPYIDSMSSIKNKWVRDITSGKNQEKIIHTEHDFISVVSKSWDKHLNSITGVASDVKEKIDVNEIINNLHIIAIALDPNLKCLRDLCLSEHVKLLMKIKDQTLQKIEEIYSVKESQIMVFIDYPPQFYLFHVHFRCIPNRTKGVTEHFKSMTIGTAILLDDVIENLEYDISYYKTHSITCSVRNNHPLYLLATSTADKKALTIHELLNKDQ
ncbi:hypothetical protein RFI_24473 [Reticulomyxa filosa]|uniref:M7GpppX diphosphatase n=1 Tax=Reticulomyxa filosa TaxID=46433 RepID=X6MGA4_RETFI|nr:hypothetical protein RFI_24473 [Reticulomyxa filosa]|eukprot:ETO12899.1 hypothetical protein RFI_24473 [Reticulomyxa filosa]